MDKRDVIQRAEQWLTPLFDKETQEEVRQLFSGEYKLLEDAFYKNLEFGTGGLRGIMGAGTNRMNRYTVAMATQGLAQYVRRCEDSKSNDASPSLRAVVCFDCRNNSKLFAQTTAQVFAANGFEVYLFEELRPTPELSYAIKALNCNVGVMITASHNPREYNGYKAYWADGGQIMPPHDSAVVDEIGKIKLEDVKGLEGSYEADFHSHIHLIGAEMDEAYLNAILPQIGLNKESIAKHNSIKIVYTPLHGTGVKMVPMALQRLGFTNIIHVPEQDVNDGNFPTVVSPNPEEHAALEMAIARAMETGAEIVLASDPDADRAAVAVRTHSGEFMLFNGNQTASLLTWYMLHNRRSKGMQHSSDYTIKTIVTTQLISKITESFGLECIDVLTGFKYIAQVVNENRGKREFVCGGEESYGFNIGDKVGDKDAVITCALVCEVAAWAKEQGKSLIDLLMDIYCEYGFFKEVLISKTLKGIDGLSQIRQMMKSYREEPLTEIAGIKVSHIKDYLSSTDTCFATGSVTPLLLPKSDVIQYVFADDTVVTVRPSGTEPKIKFYISARGELANLTSYNTISRLLDTRIEQITNSFVK